MHKIEITYDPLNGHAVADGECQTVVDNIVLQYRDKMVGRIARTYSTSLIFDMLRLEVVRGNIKHTDIIFMFEGKEVVVNEYGAIVDWPRGFCDHHGDVAENIIRLAAKMMEAEIEKRKKERGW